MVFPMIFYAVFLVSLSTLSFEVLLTRVFSIGQWNHLSFMVISIALFGFAASGTFLSILDTRNERRKDAFTTRSAVVLITVLYSASALLSFMTLNNIPLDYFRLPLEPVQSVYLLLAFILLALPFFFSGLMIALAYTLVPLKTGFTYFVSMAGSACGAALPALGIPLFGEEKLIILSAMVPLTLLPALFFNRNHPPAARKRLSSIKAITFSTGLVTAGIAVFLMTTTGFFIIRVDPSPYKALSQVLQYPNTRIDQTVASIRGRLQKVQSPYIRFAPGLSLKYADSLPSQPAAFRDGDHQFVLYRLSPPAGADFARHTLSFAAYHLVQRPAKVLVIEDGGGLAIPCAIASGSRDITIVANNPQLVPFIFSHYKLPVIGHNPRSFLARTNEKFDIIHVENWGTSIPGADALNQAHLFTENAFFEYLQHLSPNGVMTMSRRLLLPPSDAIRLWAEAYEGLRLFNVANPRAHLAMLRNWDTYALIVSSAPLTGTRALQQFASDLNFDLVYLPDMDRKLANKYNIFKEPYHFNEINRLAEAYAMGAEQHYFRAYLLDVRPQTDRRPFPGRFLKWPRLKELYKSMGSRFYALFMSGEVIVSVIFIEALAVAVFLLVIPILVFLKASRKPSTSQGIYFLGVGAGFMFSELFFIKQYILIFSDPVISFTVVLAAILVFSSLGGLWTQRTKFKVLRLRNLLLILIALLLATIMGIGWVVDQILKFSITWQYISAFLLLCPIGFLMGLPFPLGMRYLLQNPAQRAYAWSANGCASVLASIGSAQIALSFGLPHIMFAAILAYAFALLAVYRR
jgi:hypothetical protein